MAENDNSQLTSDQQKAIPALLTCATIKSAALACGLAERTLHGYLELEHFRAELARRQDVVIKATAAVLAGMSRVIQALRDLLQDTETPANVKARVALDCLARMRQFVELADLAKRAALLEE